MRHSILKRRRICRVTYYKRDQIVVYKCSLKLLSKIFHQTTINNQLINSEEQLGKRFYMVVHI